MQVKDYLKHPKPSGYRSIHILFEIPVYFLEETKNLLVKIQFRTIVMDFWASLEHGLKYKNTAIDSELSNQLKKVAEEITRLGEEMLTIRKKIEN
ncbi:GTP pyrophosphokinase family protein [Enterococcus faecium]|uniref:GTP pyrophosphokinase n=1 Tax=Enterococcus faecium TaxID=1352 RepID=UPI002239351E|nr:hypothetical protein [Enterococcus faecium]